MPNPSVPSCMRTRLTTILLLFVSIGAQAQRLDPDQDPYWTRYTIVEDSSTLVPLQGDYRVYYLQSGMWWSYMVPEYPLRGLPEQSTRLLPLFARDRPAFKSTPARGLDYPQVRLAVVRGLDTMVVELTTYFYAPPAQVMDRCVRTDCRRRPPVVLPFRPGRYIGNGAPFGPDGAANGDPRTTELTELFDELWSEALQDDAVVPQLNNDTCTQELHVPVDLDRPETDHRDAWLIRSAYCGTHFVRFPSVGPTTDYIIDFAPYLPEIPGGTKRVHVPAGDHMDTPTNVTDWPIGDHLVRRSAGGIEETFTLKLR